MDSSKFVRIGIEDIPKYFIAEYNLMPSVHSLWIYFEIVKGCYGIPQAGILASNLLRKRLNMAGYYEPTTTPVLWRQKFSLSTISASSTWETATFTTSAHSSLTTT